MNEIVRVRTEIESNNKKRFLKWQLVSTEEEEDMQNDGSH